MIAGPWRVGAFYDGPPMGGWGVEREVRNGREVAGVIHDRDVAERIVRMLNASLVEGWAANTEDPDVMEFVTRDPHEWSKGCVRAVLMMERPPHTDAHPAEGETGPVGELHGSERETIRWAIGQLMAEEGDFHRAVAALGRMVGMSYPAADIDVHEASLAKMLGQTPAARSPDTENER